MSVIAKVVMPGTLAVSVLNGIRSLAWSIGAIGAFVFLISSSRQQAGSQRTISQTCCVLRTFKMTLPPVLPVSLSSCAFPDLPIDRVYTCIMNSYEYLVVGNGDAR
jgi:hypothetical protein